MKPFAHFSYFTSRHAVAATFAVLLFATHQSALGVNLYWNGSSGDWQSVGSWSIVQDAATPAASAVPGASDVAIFSTSLLTNTAVSVDLNANQSVLGLRFLGFNASTTLLKGGGTDRTLTLGANGISVAAGAGGVTLGSVTGGQGVALTLGAAQTWTNRSANDLTVLNGVANGGFLLTVQGSGNTTLAGVLAGSGGLTKAGSGALSLKGGNTFSGPVTVSEGVLNLDYSASGTSKIAGVLTLAGGTLSLSGGNHVEAVTSTTVAVGSSSIIRPSGTAVLAQGALTRSAGGAVNYVAGAATTTTANVNGIVGPWATVGGADWATGTTSITANTTYTSLTATASGATATNFQLSGSLTKTADFALNTLKLNATAASQALSLNSGIDLNFGQTVGGILATGANAYTIGVTGTSGRIRSNTSNQALELVVHQYNTGGLTIAAAIVNLGTGVASLTKTGSENLILTGNNTYTGTTRIVGGTLTMGSSTALGTAAPLVVTGIDSVLAIGNGCMTNKS